MHKSSNTFGNSKFARLYPSFGPSYRKDYLHHLLTVPADPVDGPVRRSQVGGPGRRHDDVLHVPPGQLAVRLQSEGADAGGQRGGGRRARVAARAHMVKICRHHLQETQHNWIQFRFARRFLY